MSDQRHPDQRHDALSSNQLDAAFDAARRQSDEDRLSDDLFARIMGDAEEVLIQAAPVKPRRTGFFAEFVGLFGGTGGLAGAACAGVGAFWIGFAQAETVAPFAATVLSSSVVTTSDTGLSDLYAFDFGE